MARKIFYHRRSRRRLIAAAGIALSALMFFSAGLYAGLSIAPSVGTSPLAGTSKPAATLAAAEF